MQAQYTSVKIPVMFEYLSKCSEKNDFYWVNKMM